MFVAHAERLPSLAPAGKFFSSLGSRLVALTVATADRAFQVACGLGGHTLALRFEPHRMSLHCLNCGHTTPGWTIQPRTGRRA
jgi:hypothetical protein